MQITAREIADLLHGTVEGDPQVKVSRPSKIEEGGAGTITFLGNQKYEEYAYKSDASIILVSKDFVPRKEIRSTLIRVENVYAAVATLMNKFGAQQSVSEGISDKAVVHPSAQLGEGVTVGHFTSIGENTRIGRGSQIYDQVYIGKNVEIGEEVILQPGVRIMDGSIVGNYCVLQPNVVIGSDGFGFAPQEDGSYEKIAHLGNVILEDRVDVGSNTTIDRAFIGSTIIRTGTKLDNLIQIGHNVEVGAHTVIAAQAGVAGSAKIGPHCRIGGQVGIVGHVEIAEGTGIQAQSGIAGPVKEPRTQLFGSPAIGYKDYIRSYAVFKKLPELYKRLFQLEKKVNDK